MNTKIITDQIIAKMEVTHTIYPDEEVAVRNLYQKLMDGWNKGSGEAFASVFAEDGVLVAFDGTHFYGRTEIAPYHQEFFDNWLKRPCLVGRVKDVRFLSPEIAVMHAVGGTILRGRSRPTPDRDSTQTPIAVRDAVNGYWQHFKTRGYVPPKGV